VLNIEPTRTILRDDATGCIVHISNADVAEFIIKNYTQSRNLARLQLLQEQAGLPTAGPAEGAAVGGGYAAGGYAAGATSGPGPGPAPSSAAAGAAAGGAVGASPEELAYAASIRSLPELALAMRTGDFSELDLGGANSDIGGSGSDE